MSERTGIIYLAVNRVNQKAYVGQTKIRFEARIGNHISVAFTKNSQTPFHCALRKYGRESFDFAILERCFGSSIVIDEKETAWIAQLGCKSPHGYNRTNGGQGAAGCEYTDERRDKIRESQLGDRNRMKNPITAKKHGDSIRGERHVLFGKVGPAANRFGKHHKLSEETKTKMRSYWNSPEGRERRRSLAKRGEENVSKRPDVREKIKKALAAIWSDPAAHIKQSERAKAAWTDERRERQSASLKAAWLIRKGTPSPLKGRSLSNEHKNAISVATRIAMQNPQVLLALRKPRSEQGCNNISIGKLGRKWSEAQRNARAEYVARNKNK